MAKKKKNTNYNVLFSMVQEMLKNLPICFGHFRNCKCCFYNQCDECELQSLLNRGHSKDCVTNMLTGADCICGKNEEKGWLTDQEYSPEYLTMISKMKDAGKLSKPYTMKETVQFCCDLGIPIPPEVPLQADKKRAILAKQLSLLFALLNAYGEYIESDNPDVSFIEVQRRAIKLVKDLEVNVPPLESYPEMMYEEFGLKL